VIDPDGLTREGIRKIVERQADLCILADGPDLETALLELSRAQPDVLLVEGWLAAESGGAAIRTLLGALPGTKILAFGSGRREEEVFHVLEAGACGYLIRESLRDELAIATRWARVGRCYIPREILQMLEERRRRPQLTPRERGVLELLAHARSNATIAAVLGIAVGTVKLHVKAILAKLGVEDRAEAGLVAIERGFARLA
jgi:DNA-binding NarL/FixJ family response regulator